MEEILTDDMTWNEMKLKMDSHFNHRPCEGPCGYEEAALNHFKYIKRKLVNSSSASADVLRTGNTNDTLNYLLEKDIFYKTNVYEGGLNLPNNPRAEDFQVALGVEKSNKTEFFTVCVRPDELPPNLSRAERISALSTVFIVSPFMLYNLHQFLTQETKDHMVLHGDETQKVVKGDLFIIWGTNLIDGSHSQIRRLITHQFRPFLYQITRMKKNLSSLGGILALKALQKLSSRLLGKDFTTKFACFDYSTALRRSVTTEIPNAVLVRCYMHVLHASRRKEWLREQLRDPTTNGDRVSHNIYNLHLCTTHPQFGKLAELYCQEWENELNEGDFVTFFNKNLGPNSPCRGMWYIGCMGKVGLTPDNQAVEGYFRQIKGNAANKSGTNRTNSVCDMNCSFDQFVKLELPKLVANDARYRSGIRHYERARKLTQSDFIPTEWLAHAVMITRDDVLHVSGTSQYLIPKTHRLQYGTPPTQEDYDHYISAKEGKTWTDSVSANEFFAATDDFHLVTVLPIKNEKTAETTELEDAVLQRTKHFNFGTVCECKPGLRYHNCVGQLVVSDMFLVNDSGTSLADRCENIKVTNKGVPTGMSKKKRIYDKKRRFKELRNWV